MFRERQGSRLGPPPLLMLSIALVALAAMSALVAARAGAIPAPSYKAPAGTVSVSRSTLTFTAARGAKDNLAITRPSGSKLRVTNIPRGAHAGSAISAGRGCFQLGSYRVSCDAATVTRIEVSSGDQPDQVVNSTGIPSSLDGGAANDTLIGGSARDTLIGGRGPDVLQGMGGNDQLMARDRASDALVDCGAGTADKAELDGVALDPDSAVRGCERRARPNVQGPYVALGDSLSVGLAASSPAKGFVGLLYSDYRANLAVNQLLNRGEAGATTTSLRGGQLSAALVDIDSPSDTKAVTIEIGGNDAFGSCAGSWEQPDICPFRANFADILGRLKAALAGDPGTERFTTMAYYNPASGIGGATEASYDTTLLGSNLSVGCSDAGVDVGLNDVIYQEAGKLRIPVANPYPSFKQHGQALMGDSIHPNDLGYAAIAAAFRNATQRCGA